MLRAHSARSWLRQGPPCAPPHRVNRHFLKMSTRNACGLCAQADSSVFFRTSLIQRGGVQHHVWRAFPSQSALPLSHRNRSSHRPRAYWSPAISLILRSYGSTMLRAMTYYPKSRNGYRVVLVYHKPELRWEGRKLDGDRLLVTASGTELDRFIIQLTMRGIEPRRTCSGNWIRGGHCPRGRFPFHAGTALRGRGPMRLHSYPALPGTGGQSGQPRPRSGIYGTHDSHVS
jgi:hypothetical protein